MIVMIYENVKLEDIYLMVDYYNLIVANATTGHFKFLVDFSIIFFLLFSYGVHSSFRDGVVSPCRL